MREEPGLIPFDASALKMTRRGEIAPTGQHLRALVLVCAVLLASEPSRAAAGPALPEFTHATAGDWLNSAPLRAAVLIA